MKDRLRNPQWWASNQGTLAGIAIALGLVAALFYLLVLLVGLAISISATLGLTHWHWWVGLGFFGLTVSKCWLGEDEEAEARLQGHSLSTPGADETTRLSSAPCTPQFRRQIRAIGPVPVEDRCRLMNLRQLQELEALQRLAPTEDELLQAGEMADAGLRLAYPQLYERLDAEQRREESPAPIDHEAATEIGRDLLATEERLRSIALRLPLAGHKDLHLALNGMLNEVDRVAKVLAERWGE